MDKRRERFIPDAELETVEIDVKNKIFKVNGREFGKDATSFSLDCHISPNDGEWWKVSLGIQTTVAYLANYDIDGKRTSMDEVVKGVPFKEEQE